MSCYMIDSSAVKRLDCLPRFAIKDEQLQDTQRSGR